MAEPYLGRLVTMLGGARPKTSRGVRLQCRHFFSGAALYANGTICASLTPVYLRSRGQLCFGIAEANLSVTSREGQSRRST